MTTTMDGLVVLGMHRAGTSATTRILLDLGLKIPGEVVPPKSDNPLGYWEPIEIVEINQQFLHENNFSWSDPRPLPEEAFRSASAERATSRMEDLIGILKDARPWVIKDPRLSRLAPLWLEFFGRQGLNVRFLGVARSPVSVADSLAARNSFERDRSMMLWLRHYLDAEHHSRESERRFLLFEELGDGLDDDLLMKLRFATGRHDLEEEEARKALDSVLKPSLVHHRDDDLARHEAQLSDSPWVARAWRGLRELASGEKEKGLRRFEKLGTEIRQYDRLCVREGGSASATDNYIWLREELDRLSGLIEIQRKEIETQRRELILHLSRFDTQQKDDSHARLLEGQHEELDRLSSLIEIQRKEIETQRRELTHYLSRFDTQQKDDSHARLLEGQHEELDRLSGLIEIQRKNLDDGMSSSRSHMDAGLERVQGSFAILQNRIDEQIGLFGEIAKQSSLELESIAAKYEELLSRSHRSFRDLESEWQSSLARIVELESRLGNVVQEKSRLTIENVGLVDRLNREKAVKRKQQADLSAIVADLSCDESIPGDDSTTLDATIQSLRDYALARETVLDRALAERDLARAEMEQILQRASWRWTAPFRWLVATLKGQSD